ncbi:hypothetical protein [Aquimarina litoralis]|uniref:hypothetical protein n=1 Tax=Aquimarina litoralis TaxID=584605 RepID=UPI001C588FDC|nr:hypothetical protein [Aquimarina litoralis]MBW1296148.1 hypothetical protein [Aquimarina litoralis]
MRLLGSILLIFVTFISSSQEAFDEINNSYEILLERIHQKDTVLNNRTKYYKCAEDISGRIEYYYDQGNLKLIMHIYKQGFGNNSFLENYFIQEDKLQLKTMISEEMFMNTLYKQSSQGVSSTSVEKVAEVTEQRMLFESNNAPVCYERKHGAKLSEWDQEYFNSLTFQPGECMEDNEDVKYKYRLLRKAEKKLESYSNRKPNCIFHMW